jgi:hypothetical protein
MTGRDMSISAEERYLIEETLRIAEARTTHMVPEFMDNPIAKYTDPKQYEAEINTLFRNFPIIIGHVSDLAEAGDFITHDYFGGANSCDSRARRQRPGVFERLSSPWRKTNQRTLR